MKKFIFSMAFIPIMIVSAFVYAASEHEEEHAAGHDDDHNDTAAATLDDADGHHADEDEHGTVGAPTVAMQDTHTIQVILTDEMKILFSEELSEIKSGSVIRFVVTNQGRIAHEFSISNQEEQEEHAEMMRQMPNMVHEDGNTLTVQPGASQTLTWRFEGEDIVVFACNIPGHYDAGMFQKIALIQ